MPGGRAEVSKGVADGPQGGVHSPQVVRPVCGEVRAVKEQMSCRIHVASWNAGGPYALAVGVRPAVPVKGGFAVPHVRCDEGVALQSHRRYA